MEITKPYGSDFEQLDDKTQRRVRYLLDHYDIKAIVNIHQDAKANSVITTKHHRFDKDYLQSNFFKSTQIRSPFKEEKIESNHQLLNVVSRLQTLLKSDKEAQTRPHDLKVGDIICSTWGVTMRGANFFIVTDVPHPRKVRISSIEHHYVSGDFMGGEVAPDIPDIIPDKSSGEIFEVSMKTGTALLKTKSDFTTISKWSGNPISIYSD